MKWFRALLTVMVVAAASAAQENDTPLPPGVEVVKLKWQQETPLPRSFDMATAEMGNDPFPGPADRLPRARPPRRQPRSYYVYSLKLRNGGAQEIKALAWEYVFLDPGSGKELSRFRFASLKKIKTGKSETLKNESPKPPTNVVTVSGLTKDKRKPFDEKAVIKCVLYADGTIWKNPAASEGDCEVLRRIERRRKNKR